jgi:hypothetical protein
VALPVTTSAMFAVQGWWQYHQENQTAGLCHTMQAIKHNNAHILHCTVILLSVRSACRQLNIGIVHYVPLHTVRRTR